MLYSYTAVAGPKKGQTYRLPLVAQAHVPTLHRQQTYTTLAKQDGIMSSSGTLPLPHMGADIQAKFAFTPNLLKQYGYTADMAGLTAALYDFAEYVVQGGLGTLVELLPAGSKHGLSGSVLPSAFGVPGPSRSCTAYAYADAQPQYFPGAPIAYLNIAFLSPRGIWTNSDGTVTAMAI